MSPFPLRVQLWQADTMFGPFCDTGSQEITLICARVGCLLRHTPVRDAKPLVRCIIYTPPSATNHCLLATDSGRFAIHSASFRVLLGSFWGLFGVLFAPFESNRGSP